MLITEEQLVLERNASPMYVGVSDDETRQESESRWQRFDALPEEDRRVLSDSSTDATIMRLRERHGFSVQQMAWMARAVRAYYFHEMDMDVFPDYFVRQMGVTRHVALDITDVLARRVIQKPFEDTRRQIPLTEALDQFRDLKDQIITEGGVIVAGANIRMRGTIENWITDYHLAIGQGRHNAVERGNYLFHNRNARALVAADRQRLAITLKSLDEDLPLTVDTARGVVVFPEAQPIPQRTDVTAPAPRPVPAQSTPTLQPTPPQAAPAVSTEAADATPQPLGYARFSSGHRLPSERDNAA